MIKSIIMGLAVVLLASGCASMRLDDFRDQSPQLVLEEYFDGNLTAYGVIKSRFGKVTSSFKAVFHASWQDGVGTLEEEFVYDDGTVQERVWTFTPNGDNRYIGTAPDIVGEADMVVMGNTLRMDYIIRIPYKGDSIELSVRDWLHLQPDGVILNHSYMRKFGFRVAELVITIIKDFPDTEGSVAE